MGLIPPPDDVTGKEMNKKKMIEEIERLTLLCSVHEARNHVISLFRGNGGHTELKNANSACHTAEKAMYDFDREREW